MVQGGSQYYMSKTPSCPGDNWDNSARKTGFQALQKKEQEKQKDQEKSKYGAWGPTFKNREHFNSMHHC